VAAQLGVAFMAAYQWRKAGEMAYLQSAMKSVMAAKAENINK